MFLRVPPTICTSAKLWSCNRPIFESHFRENACKQ